MYTPTLRAAPIRKMFSLRLTQPGASVQTAAVEPLSVTDQALALFSDGSVDKAITTLQEGLARGNCPPSSWNDLGNMLAHAGRLAEAATAFRRALGRAPRSASLWNNLGAVLQRDNHVVGAECAFRRAISLQENFFEAHQNLAQLLESRGETLEAARHHCQAFVHGPREGKTPAMLGLAYYHLGQMDAAAQVYRDWLRDEPDNPVARHRLAACLREGMPTRVSDAYIEATFDAFAPTFDVHLRGLEYRGPELVTHALALSQNPEGAARVLDAGCGTGLCGDLLRPWARELHGVDLSSAMLARAYQRKSYDRLEKGELTAYLANTRELYDIVCAADTFNYFGELFPVFDAAAGALLSGGTLVFTVEDGSGRCDVRGWHLAMHGRYLHDPARIEEWLRLAGFQVTGVQSAALRREFGEDVQGLIYTARRH